MYTFKEYFYKQTSLQENVQILTEGGLAGHMNHLYDNWYLTFNQIKDILTKASEGQLEGTEKTDGQNLFISYSVKDGTAKSARNKGNIKTGGMNVQQLQQKFSGRGALEQSFTDALRIFEKAVRSLSTDMQMRIFGQDADVWYNAEIMDPKTANVINYDKRSLVIHRVGHAYFDKETGEVTDVDITQNVNALSKAITDMQRAVADDNYYIAQNAVRKLSALSNKKPLNTALQNINSLMSQWGVNDNTTLKEYIYIRINNYITKVLSPSVLSIIDRDALIGRIMGERGYNVTQIVKPLEKTEKEVVKDLVKQGKHILKQSIIPLENIIHDFAVEILKGVQSLYIINNQKEVKRLQKEVETAIRAIENSSNETAHEVLKQQLQKIKSVDKINTAIEGFVFDYNGYSLKLVGNFAPVNQLLGLFKYGRAGVDPSEFSK